MALPQKRATLSASRFRKIQDEVLGVDNLEMARLLGLKLEKRANAIRTVERFRNGEKDVPGTVATLLWYIQRADELPPWIDKELQEHINAQSTSYKQVGF